MAGTVAIEGLSELTQAFKYIEKNDKREIRAALREVAEPVRDSAERFAHGRISNIGPAWGQMRIGMTSKAVYVAPRARRHGGSPRPNLGPLLLEQALIPALDKHDEEIAEAVEKTLDNLATEAGF